MMTRLWNNSLKKLDDLGMSKDSLEVHEYEDGGPHDHRVGVAGSL